MNKIIGVLGKSGTAGVIAAASTYFFLEGGDSSYAIPMLGDMEVPAAVIVGASVAGSHVLAQSATTYILPELPQSEVLGRAEGIAVNLGSAGLANFAILRLLGVGDEFLVAFAIGAGSAGVADYSVDMLMKQ